MSSFLYRALVLALLLVPHAIALASPPDRAVPPPAAKLVCAGEESLDEGAKAIVKAFRDYEENVDSFYSFPVATFGAPLSCQVTYDAEGSYKGNHTSAI
jgi:hypothetical protein